MSDEARPLPEQTVATLAAFQRDIEIISNQRLAYLHGALEVLGVDLRKNKATLSPDGTGYTVVPKGD